MHAQWGWDPVFDPLHNIPLSDLQKLLAAFAVCFGSLYLCCEVLWSAVKCCTINFIPYAWTWAEHIALHTSEFIRIHPTSTSSVNTSVMSSQYLLSQGHFSMVNLHKDILCQLESVIQLAWVFLYYGKDPVINNHRCAQWTIRLFDVAKLIFLSPDCFKTVYPTTPKVSALTMLDLLCCCSWWSISFALISSNLLK